jgi:hypothetical protein
MRSLTGLARVPRAHPFIRSFPDVIRPALAGIATGRFEHALDVNGDPPSGTPEPQH